MNLEETLNNLSAEIRQEFINKRIIWADANFRRYRLFIEQYNSGKLGYGKKIELEYIKIHPFIKLGYLDKYIDFEKEEANEYFQYCLYKIANRIGKKNLQMESLQITCNTDSDLYFTISDGYKELRAYMIVVSGYVQRPHYRFIIK